MHLTYSDFEIDIYDDTNYNYGSADNVAKYDHYYASDNPQGFILTHHGIKTTDVDGELIKQVCIAASGGKTGIHDHCCFVLDNALTICCADSVFSLTLPDLTLRWQTKVDSATCFEIFSYKNDFLIHGELEISRIDREGRIVWQFSGNDIFTTPTGRDAFTIKDNVVYATNWDEQTFEIDADTGSLLN